MKQIRLIFKYLCLQFLSLVIILNSSFFSQAQERRSDCNYIEYKVLQGETLSNILYDKMKISPVYGKNGFINKVLKKNRGSILKKGDLIVAGDILLIPNIHQTQGIQTHIKNDLNHNTQQLTSKSEEINRSVASESESASEYPSLSKETDKKAYFLRSEYEDSDFRGQYQFGLKYIGIFGIDKTNGSEGRLLTDLVPSLELSWSQYWDSTFSSRFYFGGESVRFISEQTGVKIDRASVFNSSMGFGINYELDSKWNLLTDLSVNQLMFYMAIGSRELQVNQVPLVTLHLPWTTFECRWISCSVAGSIPITS